MFQLHFRVEGVPELSRTLLRTATKLDDFTQPLKKSAKMILDDVEINFKTEGQLVGGWEPLSEKYQKQKEKAGYGGKGILERTGALRKSFFPEVSKTRALVTSRSPYYVYHQSRAPRKVLPRRAMLVLTKPTRQNIVEEFQKYIRL
jgi:phage gpG-like protein